MVFDTCLCCLGEYIKRKEENERNEGNSDGNDGEKRSATRSFISFSKEMEEP